ncbi:MAG: hypothetical protein F7C37_02165, partial [Desulfurococcales archaeon]|nr:hypothetical protein [Desulfurococcales archaeon]
MVPSWNPATGRIEWTPVSYVYRHYIEDEILEIETQGRGIVRVTKAHSLFVFRDGKIQVIPAKDIKPGDYIIITEKLPDTSEKITVKFKTQRGVEVPLTPRVARLLGLLLADGNINQERYVRVSLNPKDKHLINFVEETIREEFKLHVTKYVRSPYDRQEVQLIVSSKPLAQILKESGLLAKGRQRRLPSWLFNAPREIKLAFLKGLIDGDGHIDKYGDITLATRNEILAKQIVTLLLMLGINPTVVYNKEDILIRIGKSPARTPTDAYYYLTGIKVEESQKLRTEPTYGLPITKELKKILVRAMNNKDISYKPTQKSISKRKLKLVQDKGYQLPEGFY